MAPKKTADKCSEGNKGSSSHSKTKASRYCFTSFQDDPPPFDGRRMKWLIYAPEKTQAGQHHWQGYVVWNGGHDCCISACGKRLGKINVEVANGSPEENLAYIKGPYSKDGKVKPVNPDFVEFGTMPMQGKRTDLDELVSQVSNGLTVDELAISNPMVVHQYGRTLDRVEDIRLRSVKRDFMTKGIWIHGPTGTGKTEYAHKTYPGAYFWKQSDNGWQDNYRGQEAVIIDDFRGNIKFAELLRMVDKYANFEAPRRNRAPMPFISKVVIITSSMPPEEVFNNLAESDKLAQLLRRFEVWERKPYDYVEEAVNIAQKTIDDFLIDELD